MTDGCGAAAGGPSLAGVDVANQAVVQGRVVRDGRPVSPAYVRLLNTSGDFAGEVPTAGDGTFRFFAAPGTWTVRALASGGQAERQVEAALGSVAELELSLD